FWALVWLFPLSFYLNGLVGAVVGALAGMTHPGNAVAAGREAAESFFTKYALVVLAAEVGVVMALAWRGRLPGTSREIWRAAGEPTPDSSSTAAPGWTPTTIDQNGQRVGALGGISVKAVLAACLVTLALDVLFGVTFSAIHTIRLAATGTPREELAAAL